MKSTAIYHIMRNNVCILIPKINGKGYLKAPFGGSHANEKYRLFMDKCEDIINHQFSTCDLDGYLDVCLKKFHLDIEFNPMVELVKNTLNELFPQIGDWREAYSEEFFNLILK